MNRAQRRKAAREKKKQQKQLNQNQLFAREPTAAEMKAAEAELDRHERYRAEQTMLTTLRAVCYVLNEEYGFGTKRLNHVNSNILNDQACTKCKDETERTKLNSFTRVLCNKCCK